VSRAGVARRSVPLTLVISLVRSGFGARSVLLHLAPEPVRRGGHGFVALSLAIREA
jgi:hypothetical protein